MEIREKANNYATEKTNEVLIQAIAQAYVDGYQDGYQACQKDIPLDVQKDKTEYVDLGLPSGTLWAENDESKEGKRMYLPYVKASALNIPTEEQWHELLEMCEWDYNTISSNCNKFSCIGPNGNVIHFYNTGFLKEEGVVQERRRTFWWVKDDGKELEKKAIRMYYWSGQHKELEKAFCGYKLPVRLVR